MKWIILIGDEEFTLNDIKSIKHYNSIKCYDVTEIKNRYCVDYGAKGHIFYDYCDIISDYDEDELKNIPFENPHFIMMIYTSIELMDKVLLQNNFIRGIYIDDGYREIIPVEQYVEFIKNETVQPKIEPETIEIDVRNCVSTNEISNLLTEKLNLPEWNNKKPDELLKNLKELKNCEIYIIGANLLPARISSYINNVIDILNKVKEMYGNISVVKMDVKIIDFTDCKYFSEVHLLLKKELNFPDWYGENLSALWDLLAHNTKPSVIYLKGLTEVSTDLLDYMQEILKVFKEAEAKYKYKIIEK